MDEVTRLAETAIGGGPRAGSRSGPDSADWGRFAPGTLLAGRFRIVAPLGRGGMGEVYRADDLKLGQTVALKFLPEHLSHDPVRLARFHNEVRVARTISHRNVCRTYDIDEADGRPFLTMEYVDGEDLASLLRRIGRFPQDKAVEVARQICAGVAAAHERGVLHRDLKPANVMIDGDGHVRITDFGLASLGGGVDNVRAGTPAYMSPEQLAGREVTPRSDIYALGLVLFELFTGKRAFEANTLNELLKLHESGRVSPPSSVVRDLDPTVERAILRCLDPEPQRRPPSALAVSAALPGGNQLAAALAAGETPSPEMVAAAGEQRSAMRASVAVTILGVTLTALVATAFVADRVLLLHRVPISRSADGLRDRAQDILQRLGYDDRPADSAQGWGLTPVFLSYVARTDGGSDRWSVLSTGRAPALLFWYRTSPRELVPLGRTTAVTVADPPPMTPGMRTIVLDASGRLVALRVTPPAVRNNADVDAPRVNWLPLFEAAALDFTSFHPVPARSVPAAFADATAAFEGMMPGIERPVRVELASFGRRPTWFAIVGPWDEPSAADARAGTTAAFFAAGSAVVIALLLVGAAVLARVNLRTGRGDRRGAFNTAAAVFTAWIGFLLLGARHSVNIPIEYNRLTLLVGTALFGAAAVWLTYIALEPFVRRFWPELLIGWSRLITGKLRDPGVGREILVGVASGAVIAAYILSHHLVQRATGSDPPPVLSSTVALDGVRAVLVTILFNIPRALISPFQVVFVVVLLKALVKRTWLVVALSSVIIFPIAINGLFSGEQLAVDVPYTLLGIAMVLAVLLRVGLVALCVTFFVFETLVELPLTLDFSMPYAAASTWLLAGAAAVAAFAFYASRGDEPLFGKALLD